MKPSRAFAVLAALIAAVCYGPRLSAPLMWDDRPYLLNVAEYGHPIPLKDWTAPRYFEFSGESTWRPLATASYAGLTMAFGKNPLPLRLAMFALHLANCVLLFYLLLELGLGAEVATAAGALFLIHPAHVETLMTVTFNEELLAAFGLLVMLLAHRRKRTALAAAGLAWAVLSKETGILGLVLVPLLDGLNGGIEALKRRRTAYAAYAAVGTAYLILRFGPMKGPAGEMNLSALLPWTERLYYGSIGLLTSARVLLAPAGLRIEYFPLPPSSGAVAFAAIVAATILVGAMIRVAWTRRREPALAFFLLWPLPILFLTSNVIPAAVLGLRLTAERWLYLPAIGVTAALAYSLRARRGRIALVMVIWAGLALVRLDDWRDETTLWSSLAKIYPWSAKAAEGRGEALFRAGRTAEAQLAFERGLSLREDRADPLLVHFVPLAPPGTISWENPALYRWLGLCRFRQNDDHGTIDYFQKAIALQPGDGFSYRVLAYSSARSGDFDAANKWIQVGIERDPNDAFLLRLKPDAESHRLSFVARFD